MSSPRTTLSDIWTFVLESSVFAGRHAEKPPLDGPWKPVLPII
jgi:hypothetical protein